MTEKKLNLRQKLVEIRKTISYLQKTESGKNSKYADPAVLLAKIRQGMDKHVVLLSLKVNDYKIEAIDWPTKNDPKNKSYFFQGDLTYVWLDADSDEKIEVTWFCTASHLTDPAMAGGSALTYYERYFLLKQFQIPTAKDDPEYFKEKTKNIELINKKQASFLINRIKEVNGDTVKLLTWAKITKISDLNTAQFTQIEIMLNAKEEKQKKLELEKAAEGKKEQQDEI